jgi:RND superfamily putative drug exporter
LANNLEGLVGEFNLQVNSPFTASLRQAYFSVDETATRINIILASGPYKPETVDTVERLRQATGQSIAESSIRGSSYRVGGESATRADIMMTNDADFGIVVGTAVAGILVVITILLRSVVAPLYMVLTVLLNYGATLGITTWLFTGILDQNGMLYMLPIFIFIILVALGADYNIFLVSRIREEAARRPLKEAISYAIANTGGVITSCGIILAGTFATLMVTPLQMVMQIGTAIVIGVLIDTFIVRAILVPAIAVLVGRWSWWPSLEVHVQGKKAPKTDSVTDTSME